MNRWLVGYVAAVLAVGTIIVVRTVFRLSASDWASWVQAIGSILAILAAVQIATAQERYRQAELLKLARAAASMTVPRLYKVVIAVTDVKGALEKAVTEEIPPATFQACLVLLGSQPLWTVEEITTLVPLPGDVAYTFTRGVSVVSMAIHMLTQIQGHPSFVGDVKFRKEQATGIVYHLQMALSDLNDVLGTLQFEAFKLRTLK